MVSLLLLLCLVSTALSVQDPEEDVEEDSGARDRVTEVVPGLSKLEKVQKKLCSTKWSFVYFALDLPLS